MNVSPTVSYIMSRTIIGVGLGIGVALVAGWSFGMDSDQSNMRSSIRTAGGG